MNPYRRVENATLAGLTVVECGRCLTLIRDDDYPRDKHTKWHQEQDEKMAVVADDASYGAMLRPIK